MSDQRGGNEAPCPKGAGDVIERIQDLPAGFVLVWIRLSVDKEKYVHSCLVRPSCCVLIFDHWLTD